MMAYDQITIGRGELQLLCKCWCPCRVRILSMRSAYYLVTEIAAIPTLVPHANDMMVAAITDTTLAVLSLFSNIVLMVLPDGGF